MLWSKIGLRAICLIRKLFTQSTCYYCSIKLLFVFRNQFIYFFNFGFIFFYFTTYFIVILKFQEGRQSKELIQQLQFYDLCVWERDGKARKEMSSAGASPMSIPRPHKPNASVGMHPPFQGLLHHNCSRAIQLPQAFKSPWFQLSSLTRYLTWPQYFIWWIISFCFRA